MALLAVLSTTALAAPLEPKDVKVEGMTLTIVPDGQTVTIDALTTRSHRYETTLKAGTPGWRGPVRLPGPAWVYRALRPETLVVSLADDPATKLVEGKDYVVDPKWAALALAKGSKHAEGTQIVCTYDYGLSRIDLVERTPDGKIVVTRGKEDKGQPPLPETTPGNTPLASVYLPNYATELSMDMVNLIDPDYDGVPPVVRTGRLAKVKAKIAAGKPVTIVCLGDSITVQPDRNFRDGKGNYVKRLVVYLEEAYPKSDVVYTPRGKKAEPKDGQINIVSAGVGGDDTVRGLKRIQADVLDHKPDLVVVMFGVNDENRRGEGNAVPPPAYARNLTEIIKRVRDAGGEPLLMTTSMKNLGWSSTVGNLDEYAATARKVAKANNVCLVDNFRAWQLVPKRGYNYMVLLGNCINHPVDLGHDVFLRGLKAAFE
jgi:lysophospholipase L1-like esterase